MFNLIANLKRNQKENKSFHAKLLKYIYYNKEKGLFTAKLRLSKKILPNTVIKGHLQKDTGFIRIRILNKNYYAHRLAWFYINGYWPLHYIEHKNGDKTDNRWNNLISVKTNKAVRARNSSKSKKLTHEKLKELLHYEPNTGIFTRLKGSITRPQVTNKPIGSKNNMGYIVIPLYSRRFLGHRLACFYMTGEWPKNQVDHIDLNKANNKWENLREATNRQNHFNKRKQSNNTSGYKGIVYDKSRDKWKIQIVADDIRFSKRFDTKEEAINAYPNIVKLLHKEFTRIK